MRAPSPDMKTPGATHGITGSIQIIHEKFLLWGITAVKVLCVIDE
jgi:hypothetical protein